MAENNVRFNILRIHPETGLPVVNAEFDGRTYPCTIYGRKELLAIVGVTHFGIAVKLDETGEPRDIPKGGRLYEEMVTLGKALVEFCRQDQRVRKFIEGNGLCLERPVELRKQKLF